MLSCHACVEDPCGCPSTAPTLPRFTLLKRAVDPLASVPADDPFRRAYELLAPIGAGGMGSVHRARQRSTGREVAIKFLRHPGATEPSRRFQLETEALSAIQHPHVLALIDAGEVGGSPYLVTELLSGGTLRTRITPGRTGDTQAACEIVGQILAGLAACHKSGIVHRDLKPENIMFDANEQVKVADLGLAKARDEGLTMEGEILGTPLYMAPEQLMGSPATPASDLFAVGVMFYELVFGHVPLTGETLAELIGRRCRGRLTFPPHALPAPVALLLYRLLAVDPAERPCSAADALRLLTASTVTTSAAVRRASGSFLRPVTGSFARTSGRFTARPSISVPAPPRPWRTGARTAVAALVLALASVTVGWQAHAVLSPAASAPPHAAQPRA